MSGGYSVGGLVVEESRSRSGRHYMRRLVLVLRRTGELVDPARAGAVVSREEARPVYARGRAEKLAVALSHGDYVIQVSFVRNFLGRVKGVIEVYNYRGELVYRALYRDGELRRSVGDPVYAWTARLVADRLRIPVKKTRLGDEGGR